MVENTVDAPTGTVPVRATMPNKDELLWPGTLVTVQLTFRQEEAVVVPSVAIQVSQNGTFVFVIKDGAAGCSLSRSSACGARTRSSRADSPGRNRRGERTTPAFQWYQG
jgi:multidrug efflux pump subunit AcrA (membrane-fusion protein)